MDVSVTVSLLRTNTEGLTETAKALTTPELNGAIFPKMASPPAPTSKLLPKDFLEEDGLTRLVPHPPSVMPMDGTTETMETMAMDGITEIMETMAAE